MRGQANISRLMYPIFKSSCRTPKVPGYSTRSDMVSCLIQKRVRERNAGEAETSITLQAVDAKTSGRYGSGGYRNQPSKFTRFFTCQYDCPNARLLKTSPSVWIS